MECPSGAVSPAMNTEARCYCSLGLTDEGNTGHLVNNLISGSPGNYVVTGACDHCRIGFRISQNVFGTNDYIVLPRRGED